jgi:hypothetical protein
VLTDFGLSKKFELGEKTAHTFCGTPEYLGVVGVVSDLFIAFF